MPSIQIDPIETSSLSETGKPSSFAMSEVVERGAALLLLALAAPAIVTSAAVGTIRSRRSPFVAHLRVGRYGQPLWVVKLRTMWSEDAPEGWNWVESVIAEPVEDHTDSCDPRIGSRFAAFCRRHSIDELPQLWHVVRGQMSLVGPRPLTRSELDRYYGARAAELLAVKPGITGLWQVYGRSAVRFPQRSAMDLEMVRSLSLGMYLKILWRTLPAIIAGNGAW